MNAEEKKAHDEKVEKAKEANQTRNSERLRLMEQIADNSEEMRDTELDIKDDSAEREARAIAEDEEAARLLQTEGVESPTQVEAKTDADQKLINGEMHYLTIVNGQERWQTLKQLREVAQKVDSADAYLRDASEAVRNASRLALSKDETNNVEKVDVRSILRSAVLGDEEAIEKLASVLETRPSAVTPDVLRQIDQRLSFRTELESLERDSKDLLENPYMGRLFRSRLNELKEENPTMALSAAYKSIDGELRGAFPSFKSKATDKLERKRTLVNPPSAAARQVLEEEPEGEEDYAEVIEKMAKARGGNSHVHTRRQ
jgi:hypothetical protein